MKILKTITLLLGVLMLSIFTFSFVNQKPKSTPPGKIVDIGGYNLHYISKGKGDYTVLFIHGANDVAQLWSPILNEVSKYTKTVAIDELGRGWSDWGHHDKTRRQQAYDFHKLLKTEEIEGPYILVAHSLGGLIAQSFVKQFKNEVAGVVFVDATHPDEVFRFPDEEGVLRFRAGHTTARDIEVPKIQTGKIDKKQHLEKVERAKKVTEFKKYFSPSEAVILQEAYNRPQFRPKDITTAYPYLFEELREMSNHKSMYTFGNIPLIILSAPIDYSWISDDTFSKGEFSSREKLVEYSIKLQKDFLNYSTVSKQISINSGHYIHLEKPNIIIKSIKEILDSLKK
ncbi:MULTISPECIES: alpha/beta hydrolase [Aquimarina]|uniref:alpha/beta hydrolase n=1 Tax=Aquimarina TaxID=290174 RepID=UPI000943F00B|nr:MULTISPECIES: alpha/beta hydrolase [Aquimarina]